MNRVEEFFVADALDVTLLARWILRVSLLV